MKTTGETIVAVDVETTGVNPQTDRIVEIALTTEDYTILNKRINPGIPIPKAATRIHGITDEDVKDCLPFSAYADKIQQTLEGVIILGYNSRVFDTVIIDAELRRAGRPGLDLTNLREIDLYQVWENRIPRTLAGAVETFCFQPYEGRAHAALEDAVVLHDLLKEMANELVVMEGVEEMVQLSTPKGALDRAGRVVLNDEGVPCWNFGAHKGEPVVEHLNLIQWVLQKDFLGDTKEVLRKIRDDYRKARIAQKKAEITEGEGYGTERQVGQDH